MNFCIHRKENTHKNKYIKKLIIAILCLLLVPCTTTLATPAASSQYLTDSELLAQISKEDLFVPEESAAYVAEFHIRDMTATGTTEWDEDTHIVNVVEMYDETGEEITAYAFELDKGYITISASVDVPNPILEWSDVGEPVYAEFNLGNADKIIYLGGYNYYKDTGTDTITSQSASAIYTAVRKIGTDNLWYGGSAGGTSQTTANLFIRASFSHYGVAVTVNGRYSSTYSNISSSLSNNRLLYLSTDGYAVYGDHAVICYAYTRLESSNGGYRAYLKVMDGHNSSARYIDLTALGNTNSKYWEVCF